jgi:hypothetical protein
VAIEILGSTEFRSDVVTQLYTSTPVVTNLYVTLLDRVKLPLAGEVSGWANTNLDLLSIEALFAGSTEYFLGG